MIQIQYVTLCWTLTESSINRIIRLHIFFINLFCLHGFLDMQLQFLIYLPPSFLGLVVIKHNLFNGGFSQSTAHFHFRSIQCIFISPSSLSSSLVFCSSFIIFDFSGVSVKNVAAIKTTNFFGHTEAFLYYATCEFNVISEGFL